MPQQTVKFEQFFAAPREKVFAWFADHEKFGRIWPGTTRRVQDSADGANVNGLGSVRQIRSGGSAFEETIVEFDPPAHIGYTITKGSPIKNHRGDLRFSEVEGGTRLDYTIEFDPKIPFTGGLIASVLCASWHRGVQKAVVDIAKE